MKIAGKQHGAALSVALILSGFTVFGMYLRAIRPRHPASLPRGTEPQPAEKDWGTDPLALKEPAPDRISTLYDASRVPLPVPPSADLAAACRPVWASLRNLDLREMIEYPPRPGLVPVVGDCVPPSPELVRAQADYVRDCKPIAHWDPDRPQKEWNHRRAICSASLIGYRALISDWLTPDWLPSQISDPRLLTDKLLAQLGQSPQMSVLFAERLLQFEPQMYPAAKAALVEWLQEAQAHALGHPDDPLWEKVAQALQRAESIKSGDGKQLLETEIAVTEMRYNDPLRAKEKAEALAAGHPELGVGPYYQAWAAYLSGSFTAAQTFLQEAIRREPGQRHFRETWDRLQQAQGGRPLEGVFRTYLSFAFDNAAK